MVNYPKEFPADAAQIVFLVATEGVKPDGEHGDVACLAQAMWNIQGFGLGVWKPHEHTTKGKTGPAAFKGSTTGLKSSIKELSRLLEPVRESSESTDVKEDVKGAEAGFDWKKIPWEQVVAIAAMILRSLLAGKK